MRQTGNNGRKLARSRNFGQGGHDNANRTNFDSHGPNVRVRGKISQVYDKYMSLAREASTNGDRVLMENLYQHAEHYVRLMNGVNEANGGESRKRRWEGGPDAEKPSQDTKQANDKAHGNAEEVSGETTSGETTSAEAPAEGFNGLPPKVDLAE